MDTSNGHDRSQQHLSEDEKDDIREIFFEEIVPKLQKLHARRGNLNCGFAGEKYERWSIQFESAGLGFEIVAFEFDEDGLSMDLDL